MLRNPNKRILFVIFLLLVTSLLIAITKWSTFLSFGDEHPWLMQGILQGIIAGVLVNLLLLWVSLQNKEVHLQNIVFTVLTELLNNYERLSNFRQSLSCNTYTSEPSFCLHKTAWEHCRYELAKHLLPSQYQTICCTYNSFEQFPETIMIFEFKEDIIRLGISDLHSNIHESVKILCNILRMPDVITKLATSYPTFSAAKQDKICEMTKS